MCAGLLSQVTPVFLPRPIAWAGGAVRAGADSVAREGEGGPSPCSTPRHTTGSGSLGGTSGRAPGARPAGYAFLVSIPAAISAIYPTTVPSTNTIASLKLVTASKIPIGPPAPMTAAPARPAGMKENHENFD